MTSYLLQLTRTLLFGHVYLFYHIVSSVKYFGILKQFTRIIAGVRAIVLEVCKNTCVSHFLGLKVSIRVFLSNGVLPLL